MKRGLLTALAIYAFATAASAEEFFQDCSDVAKESSYRLLNEHFSSTNDEEHDLCQRLNDQEFLYTTSQNFFYCKSVNGKSLACEENEQGHWLPNLSVVRKFSGGKGKQFVLFKVSRLSHGTFSEGYHAFFLIPKKTNPRGYTVFFFREAGAHDNNDAAGTCADTNDSEAVTSTNPPLEIINEGQSNVIVRFNQERANCKTGENFQQILEYTWQNGSFQQTKNQLDKLPAQH